MAVAKRQIPTRSRLKKADPPADNSTKDKDEKDKDADAQSTQKADGDDGTDDLGEDTTDEGDDEDELPIGEFRVQVLPSGNFRLNPEDLQGLEDGDDADKSAAADSDDDDEDETDSKDSAMDKSAHPSRSTHVPGATEESLRKAVGLLVDLSKAGSSDVSRAELLRRAKSAQGISKSEAAQLFASAGRAGGRRSSRLSEQVRKSYREDEELAHARELAAQDSDVTGYLEKLTERTCKSTATLADGLQDQVSRLEQRMQSFHGVLAKAMGQSLAVQKLMSERMGVIESQPIRARKSLAQAPVQAAKKSMAGSHGGSQLSKSDILDTLTRMNVESMRSGRRGMSQGHRPLMDGIEAAMQDQPLDAALMDEVRNFRQAQ